MTDDTCSPASPISRRLLLRGLPSSITLAIAGYGVIGLSACRAAPAGPPGGHASGDDNDLLQDALDRGGIVRLNRTYVISRTLILSGNTRLIGSGAARIVWKGPPDQSIICDSSVIDPKRVNRNILIQGFEIDGGSVLTGHREQRAIDFYRTGQVVLRDLIVHGVGGSGICWGNSFADTSDIVVERCAVYNCRTGDALQGSGRGIVIRDNIVGKAGAASSFGDSGIALLRDFNAATNPEGQTSCDVVITGNRIIGNHEGERFTGIASVTQTGIAIGPFAVEASANITIARNVVSGCYVNVWLAVLSGVSILDNDFKPHHAALSANVRLDGVSNLTIRNNRFALERSADGPDYAAILLQAMRNIYGASTFDANVHDFVIDGNSLQSNQPGTGVRIAFGAAYHQPDYLATVVAGTIVNNTFDGPLTPIILAPATGETPRTLCDLTVSANIVAGSSPSFLVLMGKRSQYEMLKVGGNRLPVRMHRISGTGAPTE
ncbi:right-handed parallel beta-helix repeat-containing protein [uncultured Sphingomonas sp.]|uniref:right-handed parallel beta-helix repeat-containing protein n=1 Tax=uncultured Sphingomonas sp. TaxID=158754 RepID=UPI0025DC3B96|nr:right-handed parallel beta-helix repeat-containing protein [uncultured Sphingomonas sp.]